MQPNQFQPESKTYVGPAEQISRELDAGPVSRPPFNPSVMSQAELEARSAELDRREAALNARVPRELSSARLTDKDIESQIVAEYAVNGWDAFGAQPNMTPEAERALKSTTICVLILRNGFPVIGTSVAASPEAYDANEGHKQAKADALNDLTMCEKYALRNRLMGIDYAPLKGSSELYNDHCR